MTRLGLVGCAGVRRTVDEGLKKEEERGGRMVIGNFRSLVWPGLALLLLQVLSDRGGVVMVGRCCWWVEGSRKETKIGDTILYVCDG